MAESTENRSLRKIRKEKPKTYEVEADKSIYRNNYVMSIVLCLLGFVLFPYGPYGKTAMALLVFFGLGIAYTAHESMKVHLDVDGTNFVVSGTKYAGEYTFDDVEKIIYTYNKKEQRRYRIYVDGKRICEIAPGSVNGRRLYDEMIAAGVPGGFHNKL